MSLRLQKLAVIDPHVLLLKASSHLIVFSDCDEMSFSLNDMAFCFQEPFRGICKTRCRRWQASNTLYSSSLIPLSLPFSLSFTHTRTIYHRCVNGKSTKPRTQPVYPLTSPDCLRSWRFYLLCGKQWTTYFVFYDGNSFIRPAVTTEAH